ncbi:hypothetical protein KTAU_37560 [Thermogemmatispora aurantia]|jgi:hypothetical protein|uniref:Uncharacterized protein n=1 Tax=Thermogemmatispora aurantia TaxID=2045279 RepID=A0A5J4KF30_9CHLR|nr:hypothetical protein KTAU_37560 [Thermogemmatispora aurantia]
MWWWGDDAARLGKGQLKAAREGVSRDGGGVVRWLWCTILVADSYDGLPSGQYLLLVPGVSLYIARDDVWCGACLCLHTCPSRRHWGVTGFLPALQYRDRKDQLAVISLGDWVVALFFTQGWMCDE